MKAYLFWYKCGPNATTEYIYIIAYTLQQARYIYFTQGFTRMYDYDTSPVDVIPQKDFMREHKAGDILGQYAVI